MTGGSTTLPMLAGPTSQAEALAYKVITPRNSLREMVALETAMQGLGLSKDHPVALEIAGTAAEQMWIIRATTPDALDHAQRQIRARYPQAEFLALTDDEDPFRLGPGETVSVIELVAGAESVLPTRSWDEKALAKEGTDPLLGVLAAIEHLPEDLRAVAQIAMVPAPASWAGTAGSRKAVEHPLEQEREQRRAEMYAGKEKGFSWTTIIGLASILFGLYLWRLFHITLPPWVAPALRSLLHGHTPTLPGPLKVQFYGGLVVLFVGLFALYVVYDQVRKRFFGKKTPIYDQRLVTQKTGQVAYRVRLRLYVISPGPRMSFARSALTLARSGLPRSRAALGACAGQVWKEVRAELEYRRAQERRREVVLLRLVAAYRQFHQGSGGYFVPRHLRTGAGRRLVERDAAWWQRRRGWETGVGQSTHFASVGNLATWWHLLQAHDLSNVALVASRAARTLLMPPDVAAASRAEIASRSARIVGYSNHAGYHLPFALYEQLLHLHALIIGKSGEGKSKFYEHIALAAMERGSGLIVIDPHGDMIPGVLRVVPPHRESDVVLIDLADFAHPVGINPLDTTLGRRRDKTIADLLETLSHIWMRTWGSRMEIAFEFALRTAWEANRFFCREDEQQGPDQQFTLLDILPLYTSESFCHSVLQYVEDPYVTRWWTEFYEPLNLFMKRDIINPVATKIAKFESEISRRIVGQPRSTVNLAQVIRDRKILLLRLSKGTVGADAAPLLGATILGLLSVCLEEQGILDEADRAQFPILIDEFQVLEGVDWSMLAQLRKYGATFFLATQSLEYLQKLDPLLLPTVLANIRQIYCFNTSAQDAWTIHRELAVEPEDIINLDSHMAYVKVKAGVRRRPTFSLELDLPPVGSFEVAERIRQRSRDEYAKLPADKIDEQLQKAAVRYKRFAGPGTGTTIDVDAFEPDPLPVATNTPAQPLLQAGTPQAEGQEVRQRKRGQGGKGERSEDSPSSNRKPQAARTPDGELLSTPTLFTPWGAGSEGDHPDGDADQRGGQ
jgi:hypothetical protein